jgi:glycosyltransferase involved in cell wall biosynthesis
MRGAPTDWVVPPGDVVALEEALRAILADLDRARTLASAWASVAHRDFSPAVVLEAYLKLYG